MAKAHIAFGKVNSKKGNFLSNYITNQQAFKTGNVFGDKGMH